MIQDIDFSTLKCGSCKTSIKKDNYGNIWKCQIHTLLDIDDYEIYLEPCIWINSDDYSIFYNSYFFIGDSNTTKILRQGTNKISLTVNYVPFIISNGYIDIEAMFSRYIKLLMFI